MTWIARNLAGGRQGNSDLLKDGTDAVDRNREPDCPLTGRAQCPADPATVQTCSGC